MNLTQVKHPQWQMQCKQVISQQIIWLMETIVNNSSVKTVWKYQILLDSEKARREINEFST